MTKIITCSELRYLTLADLEALLRSLQIEFGRTAPGSREKASAASWRRASPGSRRRERTRPTPSFCAVTASLPVTKR